jgi:ABC-type transport system involved in multi-copper enzyme maturation permease subunit
MNRILVARSFHDAAPLLLGCCALATGFTWLRVWVASHIKVDAFIKFVSESLKFFQKLLPVPIEEFATPLGRIAFSYEEFGLIMLLALWAVTRGSECLAGRIGAGTMEMLLAQPIRRVTLVTSHSLVTIVGVVCVAVASWIGIGLGLTFSEFEETPAWSDLIPGAVNFIGLGVFFAAASTFISAVVRTRTAAVGLMIGYFVVEMALMIVSRVSERFEWTKWLTFLTAYEPTMLTLGLVREPGAYWPIFWQYNAVLFGLGALLFVLSAAIFSHGDVPAPL